MEPDTINYKINKGKYTFLNRYLSCKVVHIILDKPLQTLPIAPAVVNIESETWSSAMFL